MALKHKDGTQGNVKEFLISSDSDGTMVWGNINDDLTADASPDGASDYLMTWDNSALEHKKVLLNNLPGIGTTFLDNSFRVQDDGDNTKQLAFEVSAVTTATTRTWTVPDENLDFSTGASGSFANAALSNLDATAVNTNIVADTQVAHDLGQALIPWLNVYSANILLYSAANTQKGLIDAGATQLLVRATGSQGLDLRLDTSSDATADATATGDIIVDTGDKTAGTGDSGNILITTGTSSGGNRGYVEVQDTRTYGSSVQTTDATQTTILDIPTASDKGYLITARCVGLQNDGSDLSVYEFKTVFKNDGGTLTQAANSLEFISEDNTATNFALSVSTTNIRAQVTGIAAETYDWTYNAVVVEL